mmetsp:Transcript_3778/g.8287  ORF Transcript_3778/g.8287 Transcript_3778/m.8287 type:complete len:123 (+) Transcript_3778:1387-1755(+)
MCILMAPGSSTALQCVSLQDRARFCLNVRWQYYLLCKCDKMNVILRNSVQVLCQASNIHCNQQISRERKRELSIYWGEVLAMKDFWQNMAYWQGHPLGYGLVSSRALCMAVRWASKHSPCAP